MRSICVALLLTLVGTAAAHPPPPEGTLILVEREPPPPPPPPPPPLPDPTDWRETPALFEWSSWLGIGFGVAASPTTATARSSDPSATNDLHTAVAFTAGVDVTLPITHAVRVGPWLGVSGLEPMAGAELQVTRAPTTIDMFWYRGEGTWTLRAGAGLDHSTAAIAWGYRCPWKLWGPYKRSTRYEIGARIVLAATRSHTDAHDWSTTLGLEIEPIGTIRYVLGIRSWY